jgi:hypothetical protein
MATIDHLMWVVPDLGAGVDGLRQRAGAARPSAARTVDGDRRLIGLGPGVYLEVLGPDPALAEPAGFGAAIAAGPRRLARLGRAHLRHRRRVRSAHRRRLADDSQRHDTHTP